ncbi:hypothetical protein BDP55DRAFT_4681 [Colletotrichum godetiae]|uniref:Uncharacterized protein n=1 Tax=Colletotrichum godetiae TaxID=1209918 RepID=A0AAJ0B032_9PEZI|nr:uncharacterized protein BDP55DRAFT_4681 [Colletotrichum godetiae]KAK1700978.1 hypothetical protein BDP55DRAFT_4681 [Colletotrichum godetiae]
MRGVIVTNSVSRNTPPRKERKSTPRLTTLLLLRGSGIAHEMRTESLVRMPSNISFFYVLDTKSPDFPLAIHKTQLCSDGNGSLGGLRNKNVFQCPLWQGISLAMEHWSSATAPVRWNLLSLLRRCLTELTEPYQTFGFAPQSQMWAVKATLLIHFLRGLSTPHASCVFQFDIIRDQTNLRPLDLILFKPIIIGQTAPQVCIEPRAAF